MRTCLTQGLQGSWCSGITPAQHAGGPGFNPQCVHLLCSVVWALAGGHLNCRGARRPGNRLPGCPAPRQSTDSTEVILCSTLSSAGVEPCSAAAALCSAGAALCCAGAVLCSTEYHLSSTL